MTERSRLCESCGKNKDVKQFYWYKKQRTVLRSKCHKCYAAWLLSDTTGKRITKAASRGEITEIHANVLRNTLASTRAATDEQRRAKLRDIATTRHEQRRYLESRYGIRTLKPADKVRLSRDPEAWAAFNLDQAPRRARYEADTAREQARRDKISSALKGRPRAARGPSAAERLAAAARERSQVSQSRFVPDYGDDD